MKALVRNEGETITESMSLEWIDWNTGAPLTNEAWCGGPYTIVNDYVPEAEETVVIDGKQYTVEEARQILGVKL